jgi:hypothetical protein
VKHLYQNFVILQYAIKNTLEDQVLSKLTVKVGGFQAQGLKFVGIIGLSESEQIKSGVTKFVYLVMQRDGTVDYPTCKVQ